MPELDIARLRADTPGCGQVLHLNNAGASLMPQPVLEAVTAHLALEARMGGYEAAEARAEDVEAVYGSVARLLNARPNEIALMESATRAWDALLSALVFRPGDRILTGQAEYGSNVIALLQLAGRTGAVLEVVPDDAHGQISLEALEGMMDERVRLIALTHVPSNGGLINPAAEVGRIARAWDTLYLLDACQSAGQLVLDVEQLGCDVLTATGRKFLRAPRGSGFLYVREERIPALDPLFLDLRGARWLEAGHYQPRADARRFESWESSIAVRLGLGAAVDYARGLGMTNIETRIRLLADQLRERLADIPGVTVADKGLEHCGIVTCQLAGDSPERVRQALRQRDINVSVAMAESTRLDMDARGLDSLLRASVHAYNTEDELERFARELETLLRPPR